MVRKITQGRRSSRREEARSDMQRHSMDATRRRGLIAVDECERLDGDGRTLSRPLAVVEIVEVAAEALPEDVGAAESQAAIAADGEAGGVDGAGLGWLVELELVVGGDVAGTANRVGQHAVAEGHLESGAALAGNELVWGPGRGGGGA